MASWSSVTGRPWQALRTPASTLARLKGSAAPDRFVTVRLALSRVVKRRLHSGHWRRRRMALPSSVVRLSMTRESVCRQNGQCTVISLRWTCDVVLLVDGAVDETGDEPRSPVEKRSQPVH